MKNTKHIIFRCVECKKQTQTLHEIFFGHGCRKISVEYNLQVPLCEDCHRKPHGTDKDRKVNQQVEYKLKFCRLHGINPIDTGRAVREIERRQELIPIAEKCMKNLDRWIV